MADKEPHWSRQLLERGNIIVQMQVADLDKGAVLLHAEDPDGGEPELLGVLVPDGITPADLRALRLAPEGHVFTRQLELGISRQQFDQFLEEARRYDYDDEDRKQRIDAVLAAVRPFNPDEEARLPFLYRVTIANRSLRALGAKGVVDLLAEHLQVSAQTVRNLLREAKEKDVINKFRTEKEW